MRKYSVVEKSCLFSSYVVPFHEDDGQMISDKNYFISTAKQSQLIRNITAYLFNLCLLVYLPAMFRQ
jgi:hypothetical protein